MSRTLLALGLLLFTASFAAAQTGTATFTVQGPDGQPSSFTVIGSNGQVITTQGGPNGPVRDTRPQTGTGRVRGRVTTDTGQPLRRATVRLTGLQAPRAAIADPDGRYEFANLPAGHFSVFASRAGYINTQSDAFDLAENERRDNLNIRVPRGGVITGQVTDEFGDPVIAASVVPMRAQFSQGQQRLNAAGGSASTNDIGEYRLFGLSPGNYYLSVTARNESATVNLASVPGAPVTTTQAGSETGYAPVYYPGTPVASSAQRIAIAAAQTVTNINVVLSSTRLAKVSGVAIDGDGQPLARGSVSLMGRNNGTVGAGGPSAQIRPDGTFTIINVAPGDYTARANIIPAVPPGPPAPGTPPVRPQFAIALVSVTGDDISDLVLAPVRPAIVHGRVVFDDQTAGLSVKPSTVRISAQPVELAPPLIAGPAQPPVVKDDFTFELITSPGPTILRAGVNVPIAANQVPWRVKSILFRGTDVIDSGIDLRAGDATEEIEIEMTNRQTVVSGQVLDSSSQPAKQFSLILFAQDRAKWAAVTSRYLSVVLPQPQGGYKQSGLPPGDYYGLAVADRSNGPEWFDPDFLEIASRAGTPFTLREGDTKTVDFKISPVPTR